MPSVTNQNSICNHEEKRSDIPTMASNTASTADIHILKYCFLENSITMCSYEKFINTPNVSCNTEFIQRLVDGYFRMHDTNPTDISQIVIKHLAFNAKIPLDFTNTPSWAEDISAMVLFKPLHSNLHAQDRIMMTFKCHEYKYGNHGINNFLIGVLGIKKDLKFDLNSIMDIFNVAANKSKHMDSQSIKTSSQDDDNETEPHDSTQRLSFGKKDIFEANGLKFGTDVKCIYLVHHARLEERDFEGFFGVGTGIRVGAVDDGDDFLNEWSDSINCNAVEIYNKFSCTNPYAPWYEIARRIDFILMLDNKKHQLSFYCNDLDTPVILNDELCEYLAQDQNIHTNEDRDIMELESQYYYLPFFQSHGCGWLFNVELN